MLAIVLNAEREVMKMNFIIIIFLTKMYIMSFNNKFKKKCNSWKTALCKIN